MGRLDLADVYRDEDYASAEPTLMAGDGQVGTDPAAGVQMDIWECIEIAERDAA